MAPEKKHRKSLAWHVGILYLLMNLASISFFTYVIGSHQAELAVELTRYQAIELMTGLLGDLSGTDSSHSVAMLQKVVQGTPHQFAFVNTKTQQIQASSQALDSLPRDFIQNALKTEMSRDFSGRRFHLQLKADEQQLHFYVPMKEYGQPQTLLFLSVDMRQISSRIQSLGKLTLMAVVVLTLVHLVFALLVLKWVVNPIRELWRATEKVAQGDDNHRVGLNRQDEIGGLAEGFNCMLDVIRNDKSKLENRMQLLQDANLRIEKMAVTDALTGLYNRHFFIDQLKHQLHESQEYGVPFSLILLDVDFFKKINDSLGHVAGDLVLKRLGHVLQTGLREGDVAARYGGEEFVVLLPATELVHALLVAERCRAVVESQEFSQEGLPDLKISISLGVAERFDVCSHLGHDPDSEEFLRAVDLALYASKENGRNKVTPYSSDMA